MTPRRPLSVQKSSFHRRGACPPGTPQIDPPGTPETGLKPRKQASGTPKTRFWGGQNPKNRPPGPPKPGFGGVKPPKKHFFGVFGTRKWQKRPIFSIFGPIFPIFGPVLACFGHFFRFFGTFDPPKTRILGVSTPPKPSFGGSETPQIGPPTV